MEKKVHGKMHAGEKKAHNDAYAGDGQMGEGAASLGKMSAMLNRLLSILSGNLFALHSTSYCTLVSTFAYVRAIGVSALTDIRDELGERRNDLFKREEIKPCKINE